MTTPEEAITAALGTRIPKPSAITADRSGLVVDGKTDDDAMKRWLDEHTTAPAARPLRGQGRRTEPSGSLETGRQAYERRHARPNGEPTRDPAALPGVSAYERRHPRPKER